MSFVPMALQLPPLALPPPSQPALNLPPLALPLPSSLALSLPSLPFSIVCLPASPVQPNFVSTTFLSALRGRSGYKLDRAQESLDFDPLSFLLDRISDDVDSSPVASSSSSNVSDDTCLVYLKTDEKHKVPVRVMEAFVWQISCVLGFHEYLTPTLLTKISETSGAPCSLVGSAQTPLEGKLLAELTDIERESLPAQEVFKALLVSMILGMFDAHSKNIMVTATSLRYFDNSRSLSNGNGLLIRGKGMHAPSYRCALLDLPQSRKSFTMDERNNLISFLEAVEEKIKIDLDGYLESIEVKKLLIQLPPSWMTRDADGGLCAIAAMKERVSNLKNALQNVATAEDLACSICPQYALYYILYNFASLMSSRDIPKNGHGRVGMSYLADEIERLIECEVDVNLIFIYMIKKISISQTRTLYYEDFIGKIYNREEILTEMKRWFPAAITDSKDLPSNSSSPIVIPQSREVIGRHKRVIQQLAQRKKGFKAVILPQPGPIEEMMTRSFRLHAGLYTSLEECERNNANFYTHRYFFSASLKIISSQANLLLRIRAAKESLRNRRLSDLHPLGTSVNSVYRISGNLEFFQPVILESAGTRVEQEERKVPRRPPGLKTLALAGLLLLSTTEGRRGARLTEQRGARARAIANARFRTNVNCEDGTSAVTDDSENL